MKTIYYILVSMRPSQWTKNLVTFAALIFSRNLTNHSLAAKSIEAFVVFCLLSGVIYLINDIADVEKDKLHSRKKDRPLPSGRLKKTHASLAAGLGLVVGIYAAWYIGQEFFVVFQLLPRLFQRFHIDFPAGPVQDIPTAKPDDQAQRKNNSIEEGRRVGGKIDSRGSKIYSEDGYQVRNIFRRDETHNIYGFHQLSKGKR